VLEVVEVGPALEVVEVGLVLEVVGLVLEVVEVGLALEVEVEEAGLALQPYSVVSFVSLLDVQNLGVCKTTFVQPATRTIAGRSRFNIDVKTTNYSYQPTDLLLHHLKHAAGRISRSLMFRDHRQR